MDEKNEKTFDATKYKNQYAKDNYDFIRLNVPRGWKDRIKLRAENLGVSVNKYIRDMIAKDLEYGTMTAADQPMVSTDQPTLHTEYHLLEYNVQVSAKMTRPPFLCGYTRRDPEPNLLGVYASEQACLSDAEAKGYKPHCNLSDREMYHVTEYFISRVVVDATKNDKRELESKPLLSYEKIWAGDAGYSVRTVERRNR